MLQKALLRLTNYHISKTTQKITTLNGFLMQKGPIVSPFYVILSH